MFLVVFLVLLGGSAILAQSPQAAAVTTFPNDPLVGDQWYLDAIGVRGTWTSQSGLSTVATTAPTVQVVVIDSGIVQVPELAPNLDITKSRIFFGTGTPNEDPATIGFMNPFPYGHGTLVAGVIGAVGNNSKGIAGINWHASLVSYRIFGPISTGPGATTLTTSYLAVSQAFEALQNLPGNIVVNCSFSYSAQDVGDPNILARWKNAIIVLGDRVLIVAAAGNSSDTVLRYPAAFGLPNVVSVGSVNQRGELSAFSSRGDWVELVAPGENIVSTGSDGSFPSLMDNGTSLSAPMVSGVVSLLWQNNPSKKSSEIAQAILTGASYNPALVGLVANARQLNYQGAISALANPAPASSAAPVVLSALVPAWTDAPGIAWGGLVTAWGTGFTDGKECSSATPVTRLCGISVLVGSTPLPLTYVGPRQANSQSPEDYWQYFPGSNTYSVVKYNDQGNVVSSAAIQGVVPVAVNPGLLLGPDGKLFLTSEDSDGTVLYATGLGFTDPTLPAGKVGDGTEKVLAPVQVFLDGQPVQSTASASGRWSGVYKVRIPNVPSAAKTLMIKVGDWQKSFVL